VEPNIGQHLSDAARSFYRIFKHARPHVVHLHNPTPTVYAALPARIAGVPSVVSTRHSLVAPPYRKIAEMKYAASAICCDWIVGVCNATANNLKSLHSVHAKKIVRIYNGVAPLNPVDLEHCPPKTGFTLLYVGRLAPIKNLPLLLNAFHSALARMPDLRLWMVGDGVERTTLGTLAAELGISRQVTFWGQQLDVAPFFSAADAFIMSSESEGLPVSLLQAFSLGLPAIVTDVGGMAEAVRLAKGGVTVPLTSQAEMTAAILRLAGSDAERKQFSTNSATAFHSHFTLQKMADAYMEFYLNTRRTRRAANH
jgi:glycosyltransferase involved in cell wall biosynthesis